MEVSSWQGERPPSLKESSRPHNMASQVCAGYFSVPWYLDEWCWCAAVCLVHVTAGIGRICKCTWQHTTVYCIIWSSEYAWPFLQITWVLFVCWMPIRSWCAEFIKSEKASHPDFDEIQMNSTITNQFSSVLNLLQKTCIKYSILNNLWPFPCLKNIRLFISSACGLCKCIYHYLSCLQLG